METDDPARRIRDLEREVNRLRAQARRLVDDLDWSESQTRVYRRLVEKLLREADREDRHDLPPTH